MAGAVGAAARPGECAMTIPVIVPVLAVICFVAWVANVGGLPERLLRGYYRLLRGWAWPGDEDSYVAFNRWGDGMLRGCHLAVPARRSCHPGLAPLR